jgi:hypothetical protein
MEEKEPTEEYQSWSADEPEPAAEAAEIPEEVDEESQKREQVTAAVLRLESSFKGGANWFFWIAALSIINTILIVSGSGWSFVVGLGVTQIVDAIMAALKENGTLSSGVSIAIAFVFDLIAAGVFVVFGILCRARQMWAFWVGMALYLLDGLIFLMVSDFLSLGFHVLVLFFIYGGLKAGRQLQALENVVAAQQKVEQESSA